MSGYRKAVIELLGDEPDTVEVEGRRECRWCGRVYAGNIADNQVPELCPSDDCPGHRARAILEREDTKRIEAAVQSAGQDFWAAIAEEFPEITTGDLGPGSSMKFYEACVSVVRDWLRSNRER